MRVRSIANRLRKFLHSTDEKTHRADCFDGDYTSTAESVIIGGCGRSGTTLLRVMLDSHRNICCGPESWLFTPQKISIQRLSYIFSMTNEQVEFFYSTAGSRAEFIDKLFAAYCHQTKKKRWAEKTPKNITQMDFIWKAFPRARFLHMVRDGRDVVYSLRTHPRYKIEGDQIIPLDTWKPIEQCLERWVSDVNASRPFWNDPRYMEVRYESLILETRSTLEKVMDFIGEPWDENVMTYYQEVSPSRDVAKFPQNPEARQPVTADSMDRWRRDFSNEDKAIFKQTAGELLIELGYESSNDW